MKKGGLKCYGVKELMMTYELWQSKEENSYLFIPKSNTSKDEIKKHKQITPDLELIWTYEAKTHFEAMQAFNNYMDWGEYKPEPDWDNIIYE